MADIVHRQGYGRMMEVFDGGAANAEIRLLKTAEADDALRDYQTMTALLAGTSVEADFTNYIDKDITNANITITYDDANNRVDLDIPDQTWTSAGNATNNTLAKLVFCQDAGAGDANKIPMSSHDFVVTTDGSDLTAQIATAGLMRAAG